MVKTDTYFYWVNVGAGVASGVGYVNLGVHISKGTAQWQPHVSFTFLGLRKSQRSHLLCT